MGRLSLTLFAVLLPLLAAALSLGAYLNYASVRNAYLETVSNRLDRVAERIAHDAEAALSMGMPLAGQDVLTRLLAREVAADPLIVAADVVVASTVLHSSDPSREGGDPAAGPAVLVRERPVVSAFGTPEGVVAVRASQGLIDAALSRLAEGILAIALTALGLAALAAACVVIISLRRRLEGSGTGEVPPEVMRAIAEVDDEHAAIALRLNGGPA